MIRKTMLLLTLLAALCAAYPALSESAGGIRGYSRAAGYTYVSFGFYPTEADGTVRPIVWRVLKNEDGEAFLLSEYILFGAPVQGDCEHYKDWESSDLYGCLNGAFLNAAFTAQEQSVLLRRTEDNALVTLITSDDMKDASIGFSSNAARLCESTAWAKLLPEAPLFELPDANGEGPWKSLFIYPKDGLYSPWWSRTLSPDYPQEQIRVMGEGKIGHISAGSSDVGVRPAIHVDLNLLRIQGGSGSLASPYQLTAAPEDANQEAVPAADDSSFQPEPTQVPVGEAPVMILATAQPGAKADAEAPAEEQDDAANPGTVHALFPTLTEQGFLPEGEEEFVFQDGAKGLWLYCSQTLRIEINRRTGVNSKKQPLRWYEARIFTRDETERFDFLPYDAAHYASAGDRYITYADNIAQQHKAVFAINSDQFIYRVQRAQEESFSYPIGVIIRDGQVLFDQPKKAGSTVYPPLDVMALYPDGSVTLYQNSAVTAQELLDAGATDALSYGPILVENGQVSSRAREFGSTPTSRTAWGMAEPGCYIAVVVEARTSESKGESCLWLSEKMAELGCSSAINLGSGATSVMMFMGHQINQSGSSDDVSNRRQNELFGIGHSDNII